MTPDTFREQMRNEGFVEFVTIERDPLGALDDHAHAPVTKALVLDGEIFITIDGVERRYPAGTIFGLDANQPHSERYGSVGVTYLVARKPLA